MSISRASSRYFSLISLVGGRQRLAGSPINSMHSLSTRDIREKYREEAREMLIQCGTPRVIEA
jgi:hypothetical protein